MKELKCPVCGSPLVVTHQERYETLGEHVSDPNQLCSLKDGLQCSNLGCRSLEVGAVWLEDGEMYINKSLKTTVPNINWLDAHYEMEKLTNGNYHAVGSFEYYYQMGKAAVKKHTIEFELFNKWHFTIEPQIYGHDYPIEKTYMPKRFSYRIFVMKRVSEYGYRPVYSIFSQIKWYVDRFKSCLSDVKSKIKKGKSPSRWDITTLKDLTFCAENGNPNKKLSARIGNLIIMNFNKKLWLEAVEILNNHK